MVDVVQNDKGLVRGLLAMVGGNENENKAGCTVILEEWAFVSLWRMYWGEGTEIFSEKNNFVVVTVVQPHAVGRGRVLSLSRGGISKGWGLALQDS